LQLWELLREKKTHGEKLKRRGGFLYVTERTVARLYRSFRRAVGTKDKIAIFKQFQRAENIFFGRHLDKEELLRKMKEWKEKGFID